MGTALGDLIEKEVIELDSLENKTVGIDAFNALYQFLSNIRGQDGSPLMDSNGNITSHLTGLFYRTTNLLGRNIKPVFVFDGKPHELKEKTRQKRREIRTSAEKKMLEAQKKGDLETAKKFAQQTSKLTKEMIEEAKKLVEFMGLPVIQAKGEGEAQVSVMTEKGKLDGCVSQDYDALLFGTPILFRNITIGGKRKVPGRNIYIDSYPEKIELNKVLEKNNIDRKKLVWIAILIGNDFNEKFPKIGPKTALKLVKENNSFEEIIKQTGFEPEFDFREIEKIFLEPEYNKDYSIKFSSPDREKVNELLCEQHQFSKERVKNTLDKLERKLEEKGQQSSLGKWM
ncbi:flap endonuclease-1 [Candidatus Micrarchaeota archaeon]|nr:flap endonuclease-1 [Candidatus Micrarchaeota archaeon]MBU2476276.1 flap endonuclease-1 [Candidatus Micrarchaeota archaeon]